MEDFEIIESGQPLTALGPPVQRMARALNALKGAEFVAGDKWELLWEEGKAVFTYVPGGGGSGGVTIYRPLYLLDVTAAVGSPAVRVVYGTFGSVADEDVTGENP